MIFSKRHGKQLLLAGPLAVAVAALAVTACGGGSGTGTGAGAAPGAAPGQWSKAQVSQFTAAAAADGSGSLDSCAAGYIERDMSFQNAMAVASMDSASSADMSAAQVKAALVGKYGTTAGDAINAQFDQAAVDAAGNCDGSAAPSSAPAAASAPAGIIQS